MHPALAARGHRGNYTPRCRRLPARPRIPLYFPLSSLPLLRGAAVSISASAPGKCGGRGQLPLGTPPGFLHAARPPGCRGEPSATGNASHSPGSGCRGPEGATGPCCKRCKSCSRALPRNPAPSQCSHPCTSNPRRDSVSQVSLASRRCAFQFSARRLDHLPETSEVFELPGVLCCTQTTPPPASYGLCYPGRCL